MNYWEPLRDSEKAEKVKEMITKAIEGKPDGTILTATFSDGTTYTREIEVQAMKPLSFIEIVMARILLGFRDKELLSVV